MWSLDGLGFQDDLGGWVAFVASKKMITNVSMRVCVEFAVIKDTPSVTVDVQIHIPQLGKAGFE